MLWILAWNIISTQGGPQRTHTIGCEILDPVYCQILVIIMHFFLTWGEERLCIQLENVWVAWGHSVGLNYYYHSLSHYVLRSKVSQNYKLLWVLKPRTRQLHKLLSVSKVYQGTHFLEEAFIDMRLGIVTSWRYSHLGQKNCKMMSRALQTQEWHHGFWKNEYL